MYYTYAALNTLLDSDDHDAAYDYIEALIDHTPQNANEAREHIALAAEVSSGLAAQRALKSLNGRTIEALNTLRRLEREARAQVDSFDPPWRREERVLRSLIAYMARPVLA